MAWDDVENIDLPELINIPVYRDAYISQERVDELCKILWEEKPDHVKQIVFCEKLPFPNNARDSIFAEKIYELVICFFREKEEHKEIKPISIIGMVDLTYEIIRRIRAALSLESYVPIGQQISPTIEGPFPVLIELDIHSLNNENISQTDADEFCNKAYELLTKNNKELLFAHCEQQRRYLRSEETYNQLQLELKKVLNLKDSLLFELNRRLTLMSSAAKTLNRGE